MAGIVTLNPETHTYSKDGKELMLYVSNVLDLAGIRKPYPPEAALNVAHAAELGSCVHAWAEYLDDGYDDVSELADSEPLGYMVGYQKFRERCRPEWEHIEDPFCRDEVAGTPDRIGAVEIDGKRRMVILDIKTPKQPAAYWQIQLTAYQWLTQYEGCDLYVCWLERTGDYKLLNYSPNLAVWEAALTIAKWQLL